MSATTQSLLVPMNLAALCVSPQDRVAGMHFGKIAAEFQNLESAPYLGASAVPPPFAEEPVPPGIHLHWALPDALTRGERRGESGFRRAPNRFLVVRLAAIQSPGETSVTLEEQGLDGRKRLSVDP